MSETGQNKKVQLHTYGCKVNTYDTGLLQKRLSAKGYDFTQDAPEVHIFNTCAVTAEATKDAIREVRRVRAKNPNAKIIVTGCSAQVDGESLDSLAEADLIIANSHKGSLETILETHLEAKKNGLQTEKVFRSNIFRKDDLEAGGGKEAGHTRAFVKIQDGCNQFCTYCVIPFARGKSRSITIDELVTKINELSASGTQEVVLTGVHIGDYEDDSRLGPNGKLKLGLEALVAEVLARTSIPRIRLSSLEPIELTEELLQLYERDERLCRHFHMSIQSANTRVLQAMRRKYTAQDVEKSLKAIAERLPGSFVGMDVIVGFPDETHEEFEDTYFRLASLPWSRIHVFPYSERPGTKAAQIEQTVERSEKALRAMRLRDLSSTRYREIADSQVGAYKQAVVLKSQRKSLKTQSVTLAPSGLSRDYWPVKFEVNDVELSMLNDLVGKEVYVRITGFDDTQASRMDGVLVGKPDFEMSGHARTANASAT